MTEERATGLILRTRLLTETSLIVHWLTRDLGRVATVAKGARRPKSTFRGKLDLFYVAEFSFARSRRSELHTLREVVLLETHRALRTSLAHLQQAAYVAGLVEQTTETETPMPLLYELVREFLDHLAAHAPGPVLIIAFELKLLDELGLTPRLGEANLTPGARQIALLLRSEPWNLIGRLKPSAAQVAELRRFLHGFLIFHLGKLPRGRDEAVGGPE